MLYNSCRYVDDSFDCIVSYLKGTMLNISIGCHPTPLRGRQWECFKQASLEYNDRLRTHIKCLRTTQKANRAQRVLTRTGCNDLTERERLTYNIRYQSLVSLERDYSRCSVQSGQKKNFKGGAEFLNGLK